MYPIIPAGRETILYSMCLPILTIRKDPTMYKRHQHAHNAISNVPFACLTCRKSFRQRLWASEIESYQPPCPQCGQAMMFMGTAFKPPKHHDVKQWQKVRLLIQSGFRFHPNYARVPHTIRDVLAFIAKRQSCTKTTGGKFLKRIPRRKPKGT